MKRSGKVFLAIVAIGLMASMVNAELLDYASFDESGPIVLTEPYVGYEATNSGDNLPRPGMQLMNYTDGWSDDTPSALSYSTHSLAFDDACDQAIGLHPRTGYNGDSASGSAFTISMWVKPQNTSHGGNMYLFGLRTFAWGDWGFRSLLSVNSTDGSIWINRNNTGDEAAGASVAMNDWSQLAFVFENDTIATYVNGSYVSTMENCVTDYSNYYTPLNCWLGFGSDLHANGTTSVFGNTYKGLMDDIAVWDCALTADSIASLGAGVAPTAIFDVPEPVTLCGLITLLMGGLVIRRRRN